MSSATVYPFQIDNKETYVETFHHLPKNDKQKEAGQVFGIIEFLDNPGAEDAITHAVIQTLRDVYYGSSKRDAFDRFEEALREVNAVFARESEKREGGTLGRVNAVFAVLQGKVIYFSYTGNSAIYIQRDNKLSLISDTPDEEGVGMTGDMFLDISSGELDEHDVVLLSTMNVLKEVGKQDMKSALGKDDTHERVIKSLQALLKQARIRSVGAICVFMGEVSAQDVMNATVEREKINVRASSQRGAVALSMLRGVVKKVSEIFLTVRNRLPQKKSSKLTSVLSEKKKYIGVGLIAAAALTFVLLIFSSLFNFDKARVSEYENMLRDVRSDLATAENRFLIGEKQDAVDFLVKAEKQVDEIVATGYFQNEANALLQDIQKKRDDFDLIIHKDVYEVADLSQKGTDIQSLGMIHDTDDKNYVYEYNLLYETVLDKVQEPQIIDGEEVIVAGSEFDDNNSLVFLSGSGQVIEYKSGTFNHVDTADTTWHTGVDIKTYSSYAYILDSIGGNIYKYARGRDRYGSGQVWNVTEGAVKDAVSFSIDGDVYVLFKDGSIKKFRKGEEQTFSIRTQPSVPVSRPTKLYTHPELVNIYVLDPDNKRIVVYNKDTNGITDFRRQFVFEDLDDMRDIYVDNLEQKMFILTKDKIYGADNK